MKIFKQSALSLCVQASILASVASISTSTFAEEGVKEKTTGIEVIEVTARKRTENIKDVPISISAITAKKLEVGGSCQVKFHSFRVSPLVCRGLIARVSSIRQNRTMINTRWPRSEDVQHVLMSSES